MIRFGLIGAGFIGSVHANCILDEPRAELKKVFDIDDTAARKIADLTGSVIALSINDILSDRSIDAIIIAASTDCHGEIARAAVSHSKPFLCEKPLDRNLQSATETAQMVIKAGLLGGIAFNRRFDSQHSLLRQAVSKGDLGSLEMIHLTSRSQASPNIAYARNSGGLLRDKGAHFFDLASWIVQDKPVSVFAKGCCLFDQRLAEIGDFDTAMIMVEFARGTLCHFNFSRRTAYGYDERIEVFGSHGRLDSGAPLPIEVVGYFGETVKRVGLHKSWFERIKPTYGEQLSAFIDELEGQCNGFPDVRDGLVSEAIADAAYKSIRTGREMPVDLVF